MPAFRPIARNNATRLENRTLTLAPIPRASRSPPAAPSSARASPASPPSGTCALGSIARSSATPRAAIPDVTRTAFVSCPWGPAEDIDSSRTAFDRDDSLDHPRVPTLTPISRLPPPPNFPARLRRPSSCAPPPRRRRWSSPSTATPSSTSRDPRDLRSVVANFLSNLPAYRTGVSPLTRGVEVPASPTASSSPVLSSSSVLSAPPSPPRSRDASPAPAS